MAGDCAAALVPTVTYGALTANQRLGILKLIDEQQYTQIKNAGSAGLALPVDGVPVNATLGWQDFQDKREREFSRLDYNYSREISVSYFSSGLGPDSVKAYDACLRSTPGLYCYVKSLGNEIAEVRVGYVPPPGDHSSEMARAHGFDNIKNQKDIESTINRKWESTVEDDVTVRPDDTTKEASFEVTRGAQNVAIIVPPLKLIIIQPHVSLTDAVYHGAPVNIIFEQGYTNFVAGYIYHGQYNNLTNSWTITGYNNTQQGVTQDTYTDTRQGKGNLDAWGAPFTFDDNGVFYMSGNRRLGTIRLSPT
jgi:hypothetical protein